MTIHQLGAGALMAVSMVATAQAADCSAWFTVEKSNSTVAISAFCNCTETGPIDFRLTTKTTSTAGITTNSGSGTRTMAGGAPQKLATLNLKGTPMDCYDVMLDIFRNGERIANAREATECRGKF